MRISLAGILAFALLMGFGLPAVSAIAAEIKVISSPATRGALVDIAPQFEQRAGHKLVLDFANIAALNKRIAAGEPFDIAIVSPKLIDEFLEQGKIAAGTRFEIGRTGLGVVTRRGAARPDIDSIDAFRRALLNAKLVGYSATGESGIAFLSVLERLGIAAEMKPRIVATRNLGNALENGEVQIGITGVGAALASSSLDYVGPLPRDIQQYVNLAAGVSASAKAPDAARSLLRYLSEPAVVQAMAAKGLEPY